MTWRQIHDTVPASESLALLSSDAERLFWRMLSQSDPWGRLRGEPMKVLVTCAPMLGWTEGKIIALTDELLAAERVAYYEVDGQAFLQLKDFDKHQPESARRRGTSNYPGPEKDALYAETPANGNSAELRRTPPNSADPRSSPENSGELRLRGRGRGRVEREEEEEKSTTPATSSPGAQELIGHLVDEAVRLCITLPSQTKGQSARTVKRLLEDGMSEQTVRAALTRMLERGRPASALTDIAREIESPATGESQLEVEEAPPWLKPGQML